MHFFKTVVMRIMMLRLWLIPFVLVLAVGFFSVFGMIKSQTEHQPYENDFEEALLLPEEPHLPCRAEQVMKALVEAYPRRVLKAEFRNNDWAVLLRDTWFYYAEGRLLPEELLHRVSEYRSIAFYYQRELPVWTDPAPEQINRFRELANARSAGEFRRPHYFFDALYRASTHNETYERVKTIRFLGKPVTVHYSIMEELSLVEERILLASRSSSRVKAWIDDINTLAGWHWRNIADIQTRSFHSYGAAVDILPRSLGNRAV